ncbi:hypothetical protein [Prosthecodimorpha staleyi]|uniref:Uncharacterized protein n=1 Tax=Prosthecodimorpha staleyi TaxID=2840188 RepID=A0A947D5Z0_9HYPH|nr:hypothetical protein [Prosthecodimorpha staleyi]MBT9290948.1 hypothetical protein [Prosthecodimorpha staleyi]
MNYNYVTMKSNIVAALNFASDSGCNMALSNFSHEVADVTFMNRIIYEEDVIPGRHYFIGSPIWTVEYPDVEIINKDESPLFVISSFGGPFIELTQYLTKKEGILQGSLFLANRSAMRRTSTLVPAPQEAISIYKSMRKILKKYPGI